MTEPAERMGKLEAFAVVSHGQKVLAVKCPDGPHRGPMGPNEDLAQCYFCGSPTWAMRPWGETYGTHLSDCSLPIWHEGYCEPGGEGHAEAPVIRG